MANRYEVFEIEKTENVATLWLANAERRNAMGPAFWKELPEAARELEEDPDVRAVVLAARGKDFTVGLDLKSMMNAVDGSQETGPFKKVDVILRLQRSITAVAELTKPIIAATHGYCLGGGIDLITACDIRYAAADTVFSIRETKIAIVADVGTLQRLPRIIGQGHVAELAYTGDDFNAEHAREIQLVNRVLPDAAAALAAARETARRIAANSPLAVQGTKRVLRYCEDKTVEDGLRYVATWNAAFLMSDDLGEAMRAFAEKRPPVFRGR
jgi:enoyl-CoA hydratase